jgi:hypothetical protein
MTESLIDYALLENLTADRYAREHSAKIVQEFRVILEQHWVGLEDTDFLPSIVKDALLVIRDELQDRIKKNAHGKLVRGTRAHMESLLNA